MSLEQNNIKLYITGSKLETYLTCPKKYYFANIRKLQKPFGKKSPLLAFDQAIHKTLSSFYNCHNPSEPFDFVKLQKKLDDNWHNLEYENEEISEEYKKTAIEILKNYFSKYCNQPDLHIETDKFFRTNFLGIKGIEYGGKIDRVDKNPDGSLEIIDYKTGKMPVNGVSELENSFTVQMLLLACQNMFSEPVRRLTFIYLKENQTLYVELNHDKLLETFNKFNEISQKIISSDNFEASPSNSCSWCDYNKICEEGQKTNLSVAKLKSYKECPKKYSFKYIEKQPVENNSPKPPLLFYSYINSMLTNLYKGQKLYSKQKLMEHAEKALNNHTELEQATRNDLLKDCQSSFAYIHNLITQNGFPKTIAFKKELKTNIENIVLSANIDRLDELPNGKFQPVIYKTGKQAPDIITLSNDVTSAIYWLVANQLYPNQIDSISFIYVLAGKTINFVPNDITLTRLQNSIKDFITEKAFDGKQNALCAWCDYYDPCPKWKTKPYEIANESKEEFNQRLRLSYSKMSLYLNCPFSYKKLYLDKIPPRPQPFFDFGGAIHETFEKIYSPSNNIIEKPSLNDLIQVYEKTRFDYRNGFINEQIEEKYHKDGIRQLTLYYEHFIKNKKFKYAEAVEKYFEIPCGKYAVMTGSIDRIDALDDGTFEILDYKTEPTLRSQEEVDHDKQLSIYYWAAQEHFGYKISKLSLLMLDHDIKIKTTRQKSDISEVIDFIDQTAYKMINAKEFLPKKNKYCKSCDHLDECPLRDEILNDAELQSMQKFDNDIIV